MPEEIYETYKMFLVIQIDTPRVGYPITCRNGKFTDMRIHDKAFGILERYGTHEGSKV